jgi:hypothetical protein
VDDDVYQRFTWVSRTMLRASLHNRLMLAVISSPYGFEITPSGAATLSQAHLIQPDRALEAELQVRSSFRESLQLHT